MKVPFPDFKNALALFESEAIGTMKTTMQKFLAGAALAARAKEIDAMIAQYAPDGFVDVDAIRAIVNSGLKHSGGVVEIPVNFGVLGAIGATPVTVKISKADIDKFFEQTIPSLSNVIKEEKEAA